MASTGQLFLNCFVAFYASVADEDDSMGVKCDVVFVGNEYDGVALLVQPLEQPHDFVAGRCIEVSGRFVSEQDGRIVDERTSDRDTLALTTGTLVRLVIHALLEIDGPKCGCPGFLKPLFTGHSGIDQR